MRTGFIASGSHISTMTSLITKAAAQGPPPAAGSRSSSYAKLREAVQGCRACELHEGATQAVIGEGARNAEVMLVGEQPGDREDLEGHPFVGPAGRDARPGP